MQKYTASVFALSLTIGLAVPAHAQQQGRTSESAAQTQAHSGTERDAGYARQKEIVLEGRARDDTAERTSPASQTAKSAPDYSRQKEIVLGGKEEQSHSQRTDSSDGRNGASESAATADGTGGNHMPGQPFALGRNLLASELIGHSVYGRDGRTVGEIVDIQIARDGTVESLIVGVGGFLGLGEHNVALQPRQIEFRRDSELELHAGTTLTRAELEQLPPFRQPAEN